MPYTKKTGGVKEFHYTKEDMKRIESEDTESTIDFKNAYTNWMKNNAFSFFKKKHFHDVRPKHKKKYVGNQISRSKPKKDLFRPLKNFLGRITYKLTRRTHNEFNNWNYLIFTTLILVLITVAGGYIYGNMGQLNEIILLIFRLGSTLLVVAIILWLRFAWKLLKTLNQLFKRAMNWQKYFILILIILILFLAYKGSIDLISPLKNKYEAFDKSYLNPFSFGKGTDNTFTDVVGEENVQKVKSSLKNVLNTVKENLDSSSEKNIQKAFQKLNELRAEHGADALRWDNNIYELTKFQASKGLCTLAHCDHMDSSGGYFDDYATRFGVVLGTSAENIAGGSCYQAVADLWMHSTTGHRENMLNQYMYRGALAYDEGNCILIVSS